MQEARHVVDAVGQRADASFRRNQAVGDDGVLGADADVRQLEGEGREGLRQIVVQLARQPAALFLSRGDELPGEAAQFRFAGSEGFFARTDCLLGLLAFGDLFFQRLIHRAQFGGALDDSLFQPIICALNLLERTQQFRERTDQDEGCEEYGDAAAELRQPGFEQAVLGVGVLD